jgi:hypothetical protein
VLFLKIPIEWIQLLKGRPLVEDFEVKRCPEGIEVKRCPEEQVADLKVNTIRKSYALF